jgi:hypothetical protein
MASTYAAALDQRQVCGLDVNLAVTGLKWMYRQTCRI